MSALLGDVFFFIVAISVLVAIHEFGHYIVGRWCGMKVLRFSIGFGSPLWQRTYGKDDTEFWISAIPLGGYVKFLDEREGPIDPADEGRAFTHRPIPQRIAVLLAGPLFNFLFAIVAYFALFTYGVPVLTPAVGEVVEGSYAAEAGLETGDQIVGVADRDVDSWEPALMSILETMSADGRIELRVIGTDGAERTAVLDVGDDAARLTEPDLLWDGLGFSPGQPPAVIGTLADGGAAQAAGIEPGDRIMAIDGEAIANFVDLSRYVAARPGQTVVIELLRDGERFSVDATLGEVMRDGEARGQLGVGGWRYRQYGPLAAVAQSIRQTWDTSVFTVTMFGRMLTGDVSLKNLSGPINIAQYAGDSAQAGLDRFLQFLAIVSISLGVINLLPIPVLDGGQIVYQSIEWAKGSPLSMRSQIIGQQIGIFALLLLMSFAFYNDIARLLVD